MGLTALASVLALALPAAPVGAAQRPADETLVQTETGVVRGEVTAGYRRFRAVPFAAAPVGGLRWQPPRPATGWTGVRDATRPGPRCPQLPVGASAVQGSEDCLYLDVATPPAGRGPRPVMVWVHGGSFTQGSGVGYDAARLAADGDVVVVTVNYRLGALGFLGYPGLGSSAGFGLLDQRAALSWVARNAAAFGGDPRNVTYFGQSAGSLSGCAHLATPAAAGLFHKVILQSGACTTPGLSTAAARATGLPGPATAAGSSIWAPLADSEATGRKLAEQAGCRDQATALACLRTKPVADLFTAGKGLVWGPAYGTPVLPVSPDQALRQGRFPRLPTVVGHTRDEARLLVALTLKRPLTTLEYVVVLGQAFGINAGKVNSQYPASRYPSPTIAWATVLTDRFWSCATHTDRQALAATAPVFGYEFADPAPPRLYPFPDWLEPGAYHGSELVYLFGPDAAGLTPPQRQLSAAMLRYWARFATTGDPNTGGLPAWPRVTPDRHLTQTLAPGAGGIAPLDGAAAHHCAFWAGLG